MLTKAELESITALRKQLHACAELSGQEEQTHALLTAFLRAHTGMMLHPCGQGFYAAHREGAARTIVLRADTDALATPGGTPSHLCGHDGHAAALCGVALMLEGRKVGCNVLLLFQPAEETGEGAPGCCELFEREKVDAIYGAHNLPGFALGQVYTRKGTFACASRGVILRMIGRPTHAAYPENGLSPARAVGELLCALNTLADPACYTGMTLCTVIGVQMGERAFGAAAERAEVWLTLRGEHDADLQKLHKAVLDRAGTLAEAEGLCFEHEAVDVFPATENDEACAQLVLEGCGGQLLAVPMRWSEDFGHYLQRVPGAFFGIGAGESCPGLHTQCYEYPDELLPYAVEAFGCILKEEAERRS